ncbi:hypothetical protein LCGC14_2887650 [marine sediment metagenome]|uniref:Uncharacterized protein n=1 Tax=marine sediment metagenome TaxID=412755 RepID=A0A0F8YK13_9ZZZZ
MNTLVSIKAFKKLYVPIIIEIDPANKAKIRCKTGKKVKIPIITLVDFFMLSYRPFLDCIETSVN